MIEDIEKKAEEWFKDNVGVLDSYYLYPSNNEELIKQAYKDGYEQGQHDEFIKQYLDTKIAEVEEENEKLKSQLSSNTLQLEKMKNCNNCKYNTAAGCKYCGNVTNCEDYQYWKLAE